MNEKQIMNYWKVLAKVDKLIAATPIAQPIPICNLGLQQLKRKAPAGFMNAITIVMKGIT